VAAVKRELTWLITGRRSQLGRALEEVLHEHYSTYLSLSHEELDIRNEQDVHRIIQQKRPDVIVNTAAWTNVEEAECNEKLARESNAIGPSLLAQEASKVGAKFIHISSDYVFSGSRRTPWDEYSVTSPLSAYGRGKEEGEKLVLSAYESGSFIVRTSWLYSPWGKNFVKSIAETAILESRTIKVIDDQIGQPTSAIELAGQIYVLANSSAKAGIYHASGGGQTSWFGLAQYIFRYFNQDPYRVLPITSAMYSSKVYRPEYSVLGHDRWLQEGLRPMRSWEVALETLLPRVEQSILEERNWK
jgi:dTDP-4-dehydrorhamnose reductase